MQNRAPPGQLGDRFWVKMARATGLEPAASGVTGRRSNQLSYARAIGWQGVQMSTHKVKEKGSRPHRSQIRALAVAREL